MASKLIVENYNMKKAVGITSGEATQSIEINHGLEFTSPMFVFYDREHNQIEIECAWKVYGQKDKTIITFSEIVEGIKTVLILEDEE